MRSLITLCLLSISAYAAVAPSPVADAAMQGDKGAIKTLLQSKADVNAAQPDGATALQWAAYKSDLDMLDLLLRAGANVKAANQDGATALSLASERGNAAMIDRLLAAGADVDEKGPHGETPLMMASRNGMIPLRPGVLRMMAEARLADLRIAIAIDKELADADPNNLSRMRKLFIDYAMIGIAFRVSEKLAAPGEARSVMQMACDLGDRMSASDPNNMTALMDVSVSHIALGDWLRDRVRRPEHGTVGS